MLTTTWATICLAIGKVLVMGYPCPPPPGPSSPSDRGTASEEPDLAPGQSPPRSPWPAGITPDRGGPGPGSGPPILSSPPFVWHDGQRVFILGVEPVGWVTAELRFDQSHLAYVEVHRAIYHWPREAVGALLARACGASLASMVALLAELGRWPGSRHTPLGPPAA